MDYVARGPARFRAAVLFGLVAASCLAWLVTSANVAWLVPLVPAVGLASRATTARLGIGARDLEVRNTFRTVRVPIADVDALELSGRPGNDPARCVRVRRVDGSTVVATGVSVRPHLLPLASDDPFVDGPLQPLADLAGRAGVPCRFVLEASA